MIVGQAVNTTQPLPVMLTQQPVVVDDNLSYYWWSFSLAFAAVSTNIRLAEVFIQI